MKNLDAAVVIPSFKEGTGIIHTLASIARQEGVDRSNIGVITVINQTRSAAKEVTDSNRATAELLKSLRERRLPDDLQIERRRFHYGYPEIMKDFGNWEISEREAADQVLDSGIQLEEINLWDESHAPEYCNVGRARHAGTLAAIQAVDDPACAIMGTDADVLFHPQKILGIRRSFEKLPDWAALSGNHYLFIPKDPGDDPTELNEAKLAMGVHYINRVIGEAIAVLLGFRIGRDNPEPIPSPLVPLDNDGRPMMFGCDTNFRAGTYTATTRYPYSNFVEYMEFSKSILRAGMKTGINWGVKTAANGSGVAKVSEANHLIKGWNPEYFKTTLDIYALFREFAGRPEKTIEDFLKRTENFHGFTYEEQLHLWHSISEANNINFDTFNREVFDYIWNDAMPPETESTVDIATMPLEQSISATTDFYWKEISRLLGGSSLWSSLTCLFSQSARDAEGKRVQTISKQMEYMEQVQKLHDMYEKLLRECRPTT